MAAEGTQLLSEGIRGLQVDTSPPSLAERMQFTDDSNQAILDMHVSRVWSDLTPSRSPSLISPRPRSPEGRRRITQPGYLPLSVFPGGLPISFQTRMGHGIRHTRKEKDGVSTLSSDSGNVHDYPESLEHKHSHHYLPKSKSMPDYVEAQKQDSYSGQGHESSRLFVKDMARKPGSGGSRKTLTDLTDSGVSVVSDTCPCPATKDSSRVLSWLVQSEARQAGYSHGDVRHKGRSSGASGSSASNLQRQA
ncbi:hypothetical protein B566_EDAN008093 [Ephemera danica]|nr:hypothetical protein B566_EDAN008093 [Ephemera danica]